MRCSIILSLLVTSAYSAVNTQTFTANFDDISRANPVLNPIPTPYNLLNWQRFVSRPDNGTSVLKARSPFNCAASASILNQVTGNDGSGTINTVYPGSRVSTINLTSFYFSCAIQSQEFPGIPAQCNVFTTGTKANGDQVLSMCQYRGTLTNPSFVLCNLPTSFNKLKNVTFTPVPVGSAVTPAIFADDFKYTVTST